MTKIKICGLYRPEDIAYVNAALPDYCGFVVNFPKSHRSVSPDTLRALRAGLDRRITPVGVFVDEPLDAVAELLLDGTLSVAQLHGGEDEAYVSALRARVPTARIWRAFRLRAPADAEAANASGADTVLLDNGQGTGKTFDWSLLRGVARPYILAGGLTPETIPDAIKALRPWCLDVSSGVETDRKKDFAKIKAAVDAARKG